MLKVNYVNRYGNLDVNLYDTLRILIDIWSIQVFMTFIIFESLENIDLYWHNFTSKSSTSEVQHEWKTAG